MINGLKKKAALSYNGFREGALYKSVGYIKHTVKINMKNIRKFNFQMYDTTSSGVFQDPALIHMPGFLHNEQGAFQCHTLTGKRRLLEVLGTAAGRGSIGRLENRLVLADAHLIF